jgi:hypothetical protein
MFVLTAMLAAACIDASSLVFDLGVGGVAGAGPAATGTGGQGATGGQGGEGNSYVALVLDDGPLAYWRLGEVDGKTTSLIAEDASPYGRDARYSLAAADATLEPAPGAIAGDDDTGVVLQNGEIVFDWDFRGDGPSHPFMFEDTSPYTFEAWIQIESVDNYSLRLFNMLANWPEGDPGFGTWFYESFVAHRRAGEGAGGGLESTEVNLSDELGSRGLRARYHHVAITFDGNEVVLRVDLQFQDSGASTALVPYREVGFDLVGSSDSGMGGAGTDAPRAIVDELAVYGSALPPCRIELHYNCARNGRCDDRECPPE